MKEIFVLGIGKNSIAFIDLLEDCGYTVGGLFHYNMDKKGESYFEFIIKNSFEELFASDITGKYFILTMGNIGIREQLYNKITQLGGIVPTLIHPTAVVSKRCTIGNGVLVLPHSVIQADTVIGDNVVITMNTCITHSAIVGNHSFISGHCMIGASVEVGEKVHIGQGSIVVSGAVNTIGDNSILGAGSVLRGDMKSKSVYLGNPARYIKEND